MRVELGCPKRVLTVARFLASGFHRYEALKLIGSEIITCKVYAGNRGEAVEFADKANAKNPLQMSRGEIMQMCERAILRHPDMRDSEISRLYGTSEKMVQDIRRKVEWENGSFPNVREQEDFEAVTSADPKLKERHWSRLHFENARRSATLEERLT